MKNIMTISNVKAVIQYDPDIELFRGEFLGLNGLADFYADNIEQLKVEGQRSLDVFLEECKRNKIDPFKNFSGKFNVRIAPESHEKAVIQAQAEGVSLNRLVDTAIAQYISGVG